MVSIAPNQFRIEGKVLSKQKDKTLENYSTLVVQLNKVEHLFGPEEFLRPSEKEIRISVMDTITDDLKEGTHITCKIRKAPGHFFVIPDSIGK